MIGPIKWLRYYHNLQLRSAGISVALGCMDVQIDHLKHRADHESGEEQKAISAMVTAIDYWRTVFQRVQNCTYLSDEGFKDPFKEEK